MASVVQAVSEPRVWPSARPRWPSSSDSEPLVVNMELTVPRCSPSRLRRVRAAATKIRLLELSKPLKQQHTVTLIDLQDKLDCMESMIVGLQSLLIVRPCNACDEAQQQQKSDTPLHHLVSDSEACTVHSHRFTTLNPEAPEFRYPQEHDSC